MSRTCLAPGQAWEHSDHSYNMTTEGRRGAGGGGVGGRHWVAGFSGATVFDADYCLGVRLDSSNFLYPLLANHRSTSFLSARSDCCPALGHNTHTVLPRTDTPLHGSCFLIGTESS